MVAPIIASGAVFGTSLSFADATTATALPQHIREHPRTPGLYSTPTSPVTNFTTDLESENRSHYTLGCVAEVSAMIVCVCKGVACSKIRALLRDGVDSVEAVGESCGAGTDCGSCRSAIEDMLEEHLETSAPLATLRLGRASASL
jgi:bacterioferritin-associated ferredoxin